MNMIFKNIIGKIVDILVRFQSSKIHSGKVVQMRCNSNAAWSLHYMNIIFLITFSLAVRNTNLIRLLCAVDGRFTELMPTIRYWAKIFKVAGSVTTAPLFSNYTLVLLVIFYLQQGEQPVLPSIEELGKLAGELKGLNSLGLVMHSTYRQVSNIRHTFVGS